MTDSEQTKGVAPEADVTKAPGKARRFVAWIYKPAGLVLLAIFVWEADQIRQVVQGSVEIYGSVDADVDFPYTQRVKVTDRPYTTRVEVSNEVDFKFTNSNWNVDGDPVIPVFIENP